MLQLSEQPSLHSWFSSGKSAQLRAKKVSRSTFHPKVAPSDHRCSSLSVSVPHTMSVRVSDTATNAHDPPASSQKKLKKRKRDDPDQEQVSSKKSKKSKKSEEHADTHNGDGLHNDEAVASRDDRERREKKERRKARKMAHSEATPDTAAVAAPAGDDGDAGSIPSTAIVEEEPQTVKKKKKRRAKETVEAQSTEPPLQNGINSDEDSKLPASSVLEADEIVSTEQVQPEDSPLPLSDQQGSYVFGFDFLESAEESCFYSTRISLCLPVPAISLQKASASMLSVHLSPLLLTYFPPARGIVVAFSDPVLSAKPSTTGANHGLPKPRQQETRREAGDTVMSLTHDEFGVCWVWMTATFLVFRPEQGDELHGWTNVTSEGFVGLVSYNYFQSSVGKSRLPQSWTWNGSTREKRKKGRKVKLSDDVESSQDPSQDPGNPPDPQQTLIDDSNLADSGGYFVDADGVKVAETLKFRVVDTEMVPTHERDKWSLQIDGTLLDQEAEDLVLEEERSKFDRLRDRGRSKMLDSDVQMSGGAALNREGSMVAAVSDVTPVLKHRTQY